RPLELPAEDDGTAHNQFQSDARPSGRRKFVSGPVSDIRLSAEGRKMFEAYLREQEAREDG
ncbi:MAG: hypothetical protein K0R62_7982, partial [Nonomuraea muscovyensis]|nr:hypothetical protein [Nonomuraea muscovyensis]